MRIAINGWRRGAGGSSLFDLTIQNTGTAALNGPGVAIAPIAPTAAGTFATANDRVTRGDLATNETRTVDVTFSPIEADTL